MTDTPTTAMTRLLNESDRELAAAMLDLDASHRREADLAAELMQARATIAELEQCVAGQQHAAVCAHRAYVVLQAERDALMARWMGALAAWAPMAGAGGWRN